MISATTSKPDMIREILMAVNANAEATKKHNNPSKKSDASLFFSLAFMDETELYNICKKAGI